MRRYLALALLASVLVVAGCGSNSSHPSKPQLIRTLTSSGGQREYQVRLPSGKIVIQAHSPSLAEPTKALQLPRPATGVATVEQYDSVNVSQIPSSAHYVAGYVDGFWPTFFKMVGHWPVVVGISVRTADTANCFDMEPGNPPASAAAGWARLEFAHGWSRPCEYTMLSWMAAVRANLASGGIRTCQSASQTHCVLLWDANWTYVRHLDSGYACTQWTDHSGGLNRDESTCATWFYKLARHKPTKVICYRKREARSACSAARAHVATDRRIEIAFGNGLHRDHCKAPYRRRVCRHQAHWFNYYWRDARRVVAAN